MNLDQYTAALKDADWFYQYADDHRAWKDGSTAMEALKEAQCRLDPLGTLWNAHAPREYQISKK